MYVCCFFYFHSLEFVCADRKPKLSVLPRALLRGGGDGQARLEGGVFQGVLPTLGTASRSDYTKCNHRLATDYSDTAPRGGTHRNRFLLFGSLCLHQVSIMSFVNFY